MKANEMREELLGMIIYLKKKFRQFPSLQTRGQVLMVILLSVSLCISSQKTGVSQIHSICEIFS